METKIDFDKKLNKFLIYTPMWMLDKVRGIPNRRFSDARRAWMAPALRMNVAYLREMFPYTNTEWTLEARSAADAVATPAQKPHIPFPSTYRFKTKPMPKQLEALNKVWSIETPALFMAMGSGKTKVAIDLHSARFRAGQIDTVLVVCPVSIKLTWVEEIQKHSPIPVQITTIDMDKKDGITNHVMNCGLRWFVVGIESLQSSTRATEIAWSVAKNQAAAMVVDESSKIKNPKAIRSERVVEIGKECNYRTIMTGTPITQGLIDFYMQFEFLDTQIIGIGDFYSFRNRYAVMGGYEGKQILGYQKVEELMEILNPFVFQVTKEEALPDLPPKIYTVPRLVGMNPEQKRIYKEVKAQLAALIEGREVTAENVLDKMRLLQQIECGFYSSGEEDEFTGEISRVERLIPGKDPKIEELMAVVEETNESTIIWCRYRNQLGRVVASLRERYGHEAVVEFHGGCDEDARQRAKLAFQAGKARFIVATQSCGGMGQTWTKATVVIYMSNTFSLEDREQSEDRAHRIGQKNAVTYIDIACDKTIGVYVIDAIKNKADFANYIKGMFRSNRKAVIGVV